ncbi:hypothetical protein H072_2715 [Dactylellina haptotyla CBS 200.50]|uniref:DUF1754-domain-containing protein n=1 Tax=Dactylellina haptotyla (strain CBS 200.50) TaxID=1284197 RepID=S8C6E6_DACHA|nr:hypothetical protein H072_2715 [Dactylellina haptotyla CBS 200.50]
MAKEDYASIGGSLRLKGSAGILKPKSKRKSKISKRARNSKDNEPAIEEADVNPDRKRKLAEEDEQSAEATETENNFIEGAQFSQLESQSSRKTKTEAERKFEEARKKKLDQLLLRDASKSHRERVEEFNKYLANLSEHHDMPRIGPG